MFVGPPLILSGWAFLAGLRWLWRPRPSVGTVLNTAIFFLLCWYFVSGLIDHLRDGGRIVPYFKKPYKGQLGRGTASAGEALAGHCEELDRLAAQMHLAPLSHFGFNDDLCREPVEWHDAADGLRTVTGLIEAVEQDHLAWPESEKQATLADLKKLQAALERARLQGVPICLLLRPQHDAWCLQEYDLRQGWFA